MNPNYLARSVARFSWSGLAAMRDVLSLRFAKHRRYRATLAELAAYSERDLAELSVFRCDVRALALATA